MLAPWPSNTQSRALHAEHNCACQLPDTALVFRPAVSVKLFAASTTVLPCLLSVQHHSAGYKDNSMSLHTKIADGTKAP